MNEKYVFSKIEKRMTMNQVCKFAGCVDFLVNYDKKEKAFLLGHSILKRDGNSNVTISDIKMLQGNL